MAIEQEKIVSNIKKYFDTANKIGFMTDKLAELLGEEFMKVPASHMADYHNSFEGGLVDYLLTTTKYAVLINKSLPDDEKVDHNSLVKVCLLHQIGKAHLYKPCESEWHRKNQGKNYEFTNNLASMRVGERSVYYALSNGVTLTEDEYNAILNYSKVEDKMSEYNNSMVGELLKMGSTLAIKHLQKLHNK